MKRRVTNEQIEIDNIIYDTIDVKILNGLAEGKKRETIASEVCLSIKTINVRVENMARVLLVDGQLCVVLKAISLGIIKNPYEQLKKPVCN